MRCSTKPRSARSARRTHEGRTKELVPGPCPQPRGGPDVTAARHAHPATGDARWVTELGVGAGPVPANVELPALCRPRVYAELARRASWGGAVTSAYSRAFSPPD